MKGLTTRALQHPKNHVNKIQTHLIYNWKDTYDHRDTSTSPHPHLFLPQSMLLWAAYIVALSIGSPRAAAEVKAQGL